MIMDLLFPYERKGRVNNASRCALLLPISVYCCYYFLCTLVTVFCAFSLPFSVHSGVLFTVDFIQVLTLHVLLASVDFIQVLTLHVLLAYQSRLQQPRDERACTDKRVKDMHVRLCQ